METLKTVAQDFKGIASKVVETVEGYLDKGSVTQKQIYVSAKLVTSGSYSIPKASSHAFHSCLLNQLISLY